DVLPALAADDVELRVHVHAPRRLPVLTGDGLSVAPDGGRLVLEGDGLRARPDELRLALEEPRPQYRLVVVDLTAVPDVVRDEPRRLEVVVDPAAPERGRFLLVDDHDRAGGWALRLRRGRAADHEAYQERERSERGKRRALTHLELAAAAYEAIRHPRPRSPTGSYVCDEALST